MNDQTISEGGAAVPVVIDQRVRDYFFQQLLDHLNKLLELDPDAISSLLQHGVLSNERLKNSELIYCRGGMPTPLGLLNGISKALFGWRVAAVTNTEAPARIGGFVVYTQAPDTPLATVTVNPVVDADHEARLLEMKTQLENLQHDRDRLFTEQRRISAIVDNDLERRSVFGQLATGNESSRASAYPGMGAPVGESHIDPVEAAKLRAKEDQDIAKAAEAAEGTKSSIAEWKKACESAIAKFKRTGGSSEFPLPAWTPVLERIAKIEQTLREFVLDRDAAKQAAVREAKADWKEQQIDQAKQDIKSVIRQCDAIQQELAIMFEATALSSSGPFHVEMPLSRVGPVADLMARASKTVQRLIGIYKLVKSDEHPDIRRITEGWNRCQGEEMYNSIAVGERIMRAHAFFRDVIPTLEIIREYKAQQAAKMPMGFIKAPPLPEGLEYRKPGMCIHQVDRTNESIMQEFKEQDAREMAAKRQKADAEAHLEIMVTLPTIREGCRTMEAELLGLWKRFVRCSAGTLERGHLATQWADTAPRARQLAARLLVAMERLLPANHSDITKFHEAWMACGEFGQQLSTTEQVGRIYAFFRQANDQAVILRAPAEQKIVQPFPPDDIGVRTIEDFRNISNEVAEATAKLREMRARVVPYLRQEGDQAGLERAGLKDHLKPLYAALEQACDAALAAHKEAHRFVAIDPQNPGEAPDPGGVCGGK